MVKLLSPSLAFSVIAALLFATGCDKHDHDHDHDHDGGGHSHQAKFGGQLFELGDHFANVELLHDPVGGRLLAYLLDGHADEPIKYEQDTLVVVLEEPVAKQLTLTAMKSNVTGATTHFEGSDESLKGASKLRGRLTDVKAKGKVFPAVAFEITTTKTSPQGN